MIAADPHNVFFCNKCNQLRAFVLISKTKRKCIVCEEETDR